jgi:hypothetical protein
VAETATATGNAQHNESPPAPDAAAPSPAEPTAKGEKARKKLDDLIAKHVTAARLNLMLGQAGAATVEALSPEQVAAMIAKIESRKGK